MSLEVATMKALLLVALIGLSVSANAGDYSLSNGYISVKGSGGVLRELRVDPAGKGDYGPVIIRQIYAGDATEDAANAQFEATESSVTAKNVRIYSNPREVGLNEWDTPVRLEKGETLGQSFVVDRDGLSSVAIRVPTYTSTGSAMTLSLYSGEPGGKLISTKRFDNVGDNSWPTLSFPAQAKGAYYLEMSEPRGPVGWWSSIRGKKVGTLYENGRPVDFGARSFRAKVYDIFPAEIKIALVGPKLFAEVTADTEGRKFSWHVITPFVRDGYETRDPAAVPFSRFHSDKGQYVPIAQFKRRSNLDFGLATDKLFYATGNGKADIGFAMDGATVEFVVDPDSMAIKLGGTLALTVKGHSEAVPEFYPAFYSSDPKFDKSLNAFLYDRAFTWPIGGVVADWFEWLGLVHFWNDRPGTLEWWRANLLNYKVDEEGYVHTWADKKGWPFPDNTKYDTRHFTTNPNFILATYRYYAWTRDREFLKANAARVRSAMAFMLDKLGGAGGIITLPDKDHGGTPDDLPSNYWDDIPFGGKSAYENAYFYASLGAMASIESALGDSDRSRFYNDLREKCRKSYNELFWNDKAGRYIGCIDKNGVVRDYGFTYVNMEAATYGLPDKAQVERMYHWMEHDKTSSGKIDTYSRFRFAPRCNTIDCKGWWYLNGKAEIVAQDFDAHLENGGAILYTSGYDIMARAKYLGADNAFKRLREILARYEEPDALCGGSPLRYGENNGWQVGTDQPFPESGIVPASFLYAFLGIQATADGIVITPNLPAELDFAGVRNLHFQDRMLDVKVTRTSVSIRCDEPEHKVNIQKTIAPGESVVFGGW